MLSDDQIVEVAAASWGPYARLIGDDTVRRLLVATKSGTPVSSMISTAKGGASFDYELALKILYEGLKVITAAVALYNEWRKTHSGELTAADVEKQLRQDPAIRAAPAAVTSKLSEVATAIVASSSR